MSRESKWNENKQSGTYHRPVHHGEMIAGSQLTDEGSSSFKQNLAAPEGIDLAKRLLNSRVKRPENNGI